MKPARRSILCLLVLAWQTLPALAADPAPPFPRATAPGQLLVLALEEQVLPPEIKERVRAQVRLMAQQKVIPAGDAPLADFTALEDQFRVRGKPFAQIVAEKRLTFSPAAIAATSLHGQALPEALVSGIRNGQTWTGLSRMFHHPRMRYVLLEETDLATAGGGAVLTKEMINADVNGAPGTLLSRQGGAERSETSLGWFSNGMMYALRTPAVDDDARRELLEIARAISK